jgi:uncharacterized repeat protein (TIGR03803 family)
VVLSLALVFALAIVATQEAHAQTFTIIHSFAGPEGAFPEAGFAIDGAGNLFGTTSEGGHNDGNILELTYGRSGWTLDSLYVFAGGWDGNYPEGKVSIAPDGTMYGTTKMGGASCVNNPNGCGTVYHWAPPPRIPRAPYVIHRFLGGTDGAFPESELTFDESGSIYGTTFGGGFAGTESCPGGCGTVYKLTPSGAGWEETVLHSFRGVDGRYPWGGVVFDRAGNLYGTTIGGGGYQNCPQGCGVIYELTPSGSSWAVQTLHIFTGGSDGSSPTGGLILDSSGNLYGTTSTGGPGGGGTVFELTPTNSGWTFTTLYGIPGIGLAGEGVRGSLVMDRAGSLYGTTDADGANSRGSVFKLTPSNGSWTYTSLHDFNEPAEGWFPVPGVVLDSQGNLYGMTAIGGTTSCGCGVAFEITP